jgi:hypothetical protein
MPGKALTIIPANGGRLMSAFSAEGVGAENYRQKVNFRRQKDREIRREGWRIFRPNAGYSAVQQGIPSGLAGTLTDAARQTNLIAELVKPNGERVIIAGTPGALYRYTHSTGAWSQIGTATATGSSRWQAETINGTLILNNGLDLPVSYQVGDSSVSVLKELRENGIARVGTILAYHGFLLCLNVTEIQAGSLNGVMNGGSAYAAIGPASGVPTNTIPYKVIWSDYGKPTSWAPAFTVTQASSSATITLPFPSSIFTAGVTRVAVLNGGPDGGVLGGDTANPDGILVTAVAGAVLTLAVPTTAGLPYPRQITVTRWTDVSTQVGSFTMQGDGSEIVGAKILAGRAIVYRKTGIYSGRYTGSVDAPFEFSEIYNGFNVPIWPNAIGTVNGDFHLYPGEGGRFYAFDGVGAPELHRPCDDARDIIFGGETEGGVSDPAADVFAVDNPLTKELWFCYPARTAVLAFDYEGRTTAKVDAAIRAAAFVQKPGSTADRWFMLGLKFGVFNYALPFGPSSEATSWLRQDLSNAGAEVAGVSPGGLIEFGLSNIGDAYNEKILLGYTVMFSARAHVADPQLTVTISFYPSSGYFSGEASEVLTATVTPDESLIPTHYSTAYLIDRLAIASTADHDVQFSGRSMEFDRAMNRGSQLTAT